MEATDIALAAALFGGGITLAGFVMVFHALLLTRYTAAGPLADERSPSLDDIRYTLLGMLANFGVALHAGLALLFGLDTWPILLTFGLGVSAAVVAALSTADHLRISLLPK